MRRLFVLLVALWFVNNGGWVTPIQSALALGCPINIAFGKLLDCNLSVVGEIDSYTFSASGGDVMQSVTVRITGDFNPLVKIVDAGGDVVEGCSRIGNPAKFQCVIPTSGTYRFQIQDSANTRTGGYRIFLQRTNNPGNATAMSYGTVLNGSVNLVGISDAFSFTAERNDLLRARVVRTTGTLKPFIEVWDTNGQLICASPTSLNGFAYTDTCTLPASGQYFLFVTDKDTANTGNFRLFLERFNAPPATTTIEIGTPTVQPIEEVAEFDYYTFAAETNDDINVRLVRTSGLLEPFIGIYTEQGELVCSDNGAEGFAEISTCRMPTTGDYTLLVRDRTLPGDIGNYRLAVQRWNHPANARSLVFEQTTSGAISANAELDAYTFTALENVAVNVLLRRTAGTLAPYVAIRDGAGQIVCFDGSSSVEAEIESCTLLNAGTYSIFVDANNVPASTGDYVLSLSCLEENCGTSVTKLNLPLIQR